MDDEHRLSPAPGADDASISHLRGLAQEAGVGAVAPPAPVRLDDLRRKLTENRERLARLPDLLTAKAG